MRQNGRCVAKVYYTLLTVLTEYQLQHHLLRATCGPGFRSALLQPQQENINLPENNIVTAWVEVC